MSVNLREVFKQLADEIHKNAIEKGFYKDGCNDGEKIALIHGELSEALEALRHGNPNSEKIPAFSHVEEEMADTVIRILDWCGYWKFDLGGAIVAKMAFNKQREYLHGKKF